MNSHQRRKNNRYWGKPLVMFTSGWREGADMVGWCIENFGPLHKGRWHRRSTAYYPPIEVTFWFHKPQDRAWFLMRWAGKR